MRGTEVVTLFFVAVAVSIFIRLLIAHPIFGERVNKVSATIF
jgi:hypothetical protein